MLNAALVMLLVDRQLDAHFFLAERRRQRAPLAALLLDLRTPRGLHPGAAGLRDDLRGHPGLLAQADLRLRVRRRVDRRDRDPQLRRLGAPHVRGRASGTRADLVFAAGSMLIAVPTGVKIFNWIATMWGGSIRFTTAMLFAIAFLIEFVIGGLSGVTFAAAPIDWQVTDTYYVVAHFHYVLFGGTAFAVLAGDLLLVPEDERAAASERWARSHFWLMVVGFNLTFFVQHFLGILGMPRRVFTYPDLPAGARSTWSPPSAPFIMGVASLVFVVNIVVQPAARRSRRATTRGTRGRSSGRRPRRRRTTTSSECRPSRGGGRSGTSRIPARASADGGRRRDERARPLDKSVVARLGASSPPRRVLPHPHPRLRLLQSLAPQAAVARARSTSKTTGVFTVCLLASSVTL